MQAVLGVDPPTPDGEVSVLLAAAINAALARVVRKRVRVIRGGRVPGVGGLRPRHFWEVGGEDDDGVEVELAPRMEPSTISTWNRKRF